LRTSERSRLRRRSPKSRRAYQQSLTTAETLDETKEVTRQVAGASIEIPVTIANVSDTAFGSPISK